MSRKRAAANILDYFGSGKLRNQEDDGVHPNDVADSEPDATLRSNSRIFTPIHNCNLASSKPCPPPCLKVWLHP